jgi:UDP-glucose 4-epimerase
MKVGVTGGAGFIGTWVVDELLSRGYEAVIFDHVGRRHSHMGVETFLGDVRDATAVTELAAHVDGIIHLAAVLGTQETIANPGPAAETNILGGVNVLNACKQYQVPLVYAGVGNHWMRNTYSTTKTATERLLEQYRTEFDLPFAVVRPVNAYGPGQLAAHPFAAGRVRKIAPAFICRALCDMPIEVYGDGSQVSDMVYVRDVAKTFLAALEHCMTGAVPQVPVEIGPAESLTVLDVADTIAVAAAEHTGKPPVDVVHLPMRPGEKAAGDVPQDVLAVLDGFVAETWPEHLSPVRRALKTLGVRVVADTSTLRLVGIDPRNLVGLNSGIAKTVAWFQSVKGETWHEPKDGVDG